MDDELFAPACVPRLRAATSDLSWLLERAYPEDAALKLVGDRHGLRARQRKAVLRAACGDTPKEIRQRRHREISALHGVSLHVDAFNCLILCESLLSGAPLFIGRDGALRDLASVHGTWRRVSETQLAIDTLVAVIDSARPASVTWWIDRPVSNSGRLAAALRAARPWHVELVDHVDPVIADQAGVVASADAWVMDRAPAWVDLPRTLISRHEAWVVDLNVR